MTDCKRCGRKLTNPISIAHGYGPTCYVKKFGKPIKGKKEIKDFKGQQIFNFEKATIIIGGKKYESRK